MSNEILVHLKQGVLKPSVEKTHNGCDFYVGMGIPYAKPPVGDLKFKAPQAPEPWNGTLDASKENNCCVQKDLIRGINAGDFDCLYLNVFTPQLAPKNGILKPVMVWIHGGAFVSGSKNRDFYDAEYFMDKDVVVVTINYRLGALGFLSLKDPKLGVSGNAGLKDQVMALKWVQNNIEAFGGDPKNVTLFGESAGSASVSYLLLSPMTKGLFHKVIMQSGVATCSWAEGNTDLAKELAKAFGMSTSNEAEMLAVFENASKDELVAAQEKVPDVWKPCKQRCLCPIVETSTSEEHFLEDTPMNILKSGNYNKVPIMMGCTSNEGLLMNLIGMKEKIDLRPVNDSEYTPYWIKVSEEKSAEIGKKIKQFYYKGQTPNDDNKQCYYDYISDTYFYYAAYDFAQHLIQSSNNKVFLYHFDMDTKLNNFKKMLQMEDKGVCHAEDIFYLFKTSLSPSTETNTEEYRAIQRTTTWWTNFAKYSDPNGLEANSLLGEKWPPATKNMEYLNMQTTVKAECNFGKKVGEFWKSIEAECL